MLLQRGSTLPYQRTKQNKDYWGYTCSCTMFVLAFKKKIPNHRRQTDKPLRLETFDRKGKETMNVRICLKFVLLSVISLQLFGCTTIIRHFPSNQLPQVESLPPFPEGIIKYNLTYSFSSQEQDMFEMKESRPYDHLRLESEFVDMLRESSYFATCTPGSQGEITIEARLNWSVNPAAEFMSLFSALTFSIIPSWATEKWTITAKVITKGRKEHIYQLEDSMTRVMWVPMLFFPVNSNGEIEVRKNMWRNLILKMWQDGVFQQNN